MLFVLPALAVLVAVLLATHPLPGADAGRVHPCLGRRALSRRRRCVALIAIVGLSGCAKGQLNDFLFGPSTTSREVVPTPQPSATPPPTPEPVPTMAPAPEPPDDGLPNNTAAVAEVTARVFFVECGSTHIPGSEYATEAPVGCRLHLDATPRDAYHQPTRPRGGPAWSWTSGLTSGGSRSDYTPALAILQAGTFTANVAIDGVRSNDVVVRFY